MWFVATSNWNWKRQMWFVFGGVIHYCMVVSWSPFFVGEPLPLPQALPYTIGARSLPLFLPLFRSRCKDLTPSTTNVSHIFKFIIMFALCLSITEAHMWGDIPKMRDGTWLLPYRGPLILGTWWPTLGLYPTLEVGMWLTRRSTRG
jgi:hypothetical protein